MNIENKDKSMSSTHFWKDVHYTHTPEKGWNPVRGEATGPECMSTYLRKTVLDFKFVFERIFCVFLFDKIETVRISILEMTSC